MHILNIICSLFNLSGLHTLLGVSEWVAFICFVAIFDPLIKYLFSPRTRMYSFSSSCLSETEYFLLVGEWISSVKKGVIYELSSSRLEQKCSPSTFYKVSQKFSYSTVIVYHRGIWWMVYTTWNLICSIKWLLSVLLCIVLIWRITFLMTSSDVARMFNCTMRYCDRCVAMLLTGPVDVSSHFIALSNCQQLNTNI